MCKKDKPEKLRFLLYVAICPAAKGDMNIKVHCDCSSHLRGFGLSFVKSIANFHTYTLREHSILNLFKFNTVSILPELVNKPTKFLPNHESAIPWSRDEARSHTVEAETFGSPIMQD